MKQQHNFAYSKTKVVAGKSSAKGGKGKGIHASKKAYYTLKKGIETKRTGTRKIAKIRQGGAA